jgi:hypothetical protein
MMQRILCFTILVIVSLGGAGCAGSDVWYVDGRFTESELQEIRKAAKMWGDVGFPIDLVEGAQVTGLPVDRNEIFRGSTRAMGILIPDLNPEKREAEGAHDATPTRRFQAGGRIVLNLETIFEPLHQVAAHEFGHSLGIVGHVDNPKAIMGTVAEMSGCITRADLDALCKVRECPARVKGCDE